MIELIQYEGENAPHPRYKKLDPKRKVIFWKWVPVVEDANCPHPHTMTYDPEEQVWKRVNQLTQLLS